MITFEIDPRAPKQTRPHRAQQADDVVDDQGPLAP